MPTIPDDDLSRIPVKKAGSGIQFVSVSKTHGEPPQDHAQERVRGPIVAPVPQAPGTVPLVPSTTNNAQKSIPLRPQSPPPAPTIGAQKRDAASRQPGSTPTAPLRGMPEQSARVPTSPPSSREEAVARLAQEIIADVGIRFPERQREDRFRAVVIARLRDIRDWQETAETLCRNPEQGGVGLSPDAVEKIRLRLESRVERIQAAQTAAQKGEARAAMAHARAESARRALARRENEARAEDALYADITEKRLSRGARAEGMSQKPKPTPKPKPAGAGAPTPGTSLPTPPGSSTHRETPTMTDVRTPTLLVGPIEELRRMTVQDFQRLSADPNERVRKILDKIHLLEQESFARRFDAIRALRESELLTVYATIVGEALKMGAPVAKIIADRTGAHLPVLTAEELDAILTMNRRLRF